jgi:transposase
VRSHATGGTSAVLLGLPEFVALSANEVAGEAELLVETSVTLTGCPRCGVVAESHGRRAMLVQDLPAAGRPGPFHASPQQAHQARLGPAQWLTERGPARRRAHRYGVQLPLS